MASKKEQLRLKRHRRIKLRMVGTAQKPRLVIRRSLQNFYAYLIDDAQNKIISSLSTLDKEIRQKVISVATIKGSEVLGEVFAKGVVGKGVSEIVFDRAGYLYHGRVKAFAEGLRKGGLKF